MKVNGKTIVLENNLSLSGFLEENQYDARLIAVERNGEIVPRSTYGNVVLEDEDILEIVSFVGGG
ncbi:MAG: Sulfur carrier protein ThiS [Candidatus Dichloromethanomonas elyunquensis]|nr:MAG: Sulfur carrier protein ThiS [Candidatus Dichloromethanomonas elyunquensis]